MKLTNNQQIKRAYNDYLQSTTSYLWECYGSFSQAKTNAWNECKELMLSLKDGHSLRIISANTFAFSVGFLATINHRKAFVYCTKSYDRFMYVD